MTWAALAAHRQETGQTQIDALPGPDIFLGLFRDETDAIADYSGQDNLTESVIEFADDPARLAASLDRGHRAISRHAAKPKKPNPRRFFSPMPAYHARRRSLGEPHRVKGKVMPTTIADLAPIRLTSTLAAQLCRRVVMYISSGAIVRQTSRPEMRDSRRLTA